MAVRRNQAAILCSNCASCFHAKCSGLLKDVLNKIYNSFDTWFCLTCGLPPFSDSFFDSSISSIDDSIANNSLVTNNNDVPVWKILNQHSAKHCVIGSFNINSLGNKFSEVMEWIQAFDILTIQETKLDKSFPDSQFAIDGYNMFRRDRKKGGGGIMVYIRKSIPSHRIRVKSNEVEAILIDIQLGQQYMSLLCANKPPAVTNNTFTNEMYALLDSAIANRSNVMCLGDLNCDTLHSLDGGKEGRTWLDICDIYDMVNLITEPTRICKTNESCLDIIATNAPVFELQSGTIEPGLSDHKLVYTVLNRKVMKPKTLITIGRYGASSNLMKKPLIGILSVCLLT